MAGCERDRDPERFHNMYAGQVGLVVGNGPTLADIPAAWLRKYPSFGTNWILLHDDFMPTFYVAVDPSVNRCDWIDRLIKSRSIKFIGSKLWGYVKQRPIRNLYRINCEGHHSQPWYKDSPFQHPIWEGWSVTYVALQLAHYIGFTTVLLVGVRHHYKPGAMNHFHPLYERDTDWKEHDMTKAVIAYRKAREIYERDGRRIINLTPGTHLDVFEKGDRADW